VKQAPAWNRVTAKFKENPMVAFGDVNLQTDSIGGPYQAGAGGWPTVRYFNQATGVAGAPYSKKTDGAMCDELGNDKYMTEYITEAGSTSTCVIADAAATCNDKEVEFIGKWKAKPAEEVAVQLKRLKGMSASSMKPELKVWLGQRLNVLTQLSSAPTDKSEL
jgi:hypothetical protein